MRALWITAVATLVTGLLLLVGGFLWPGSIAWFSGHGAALLLATLVAIEAMHLTTLQRFRPTHVPGHLIRPLTITLLVATLALTVGSTLQPSGIFAIVALAGWFALLAASVVSVMLHVKAVPKRGESVVDVKVDPLTKGDDASWKHIKMAHFFLPVGILLTLIVYLPYLSTQVWAQHLHVAGIHVIGVGYGLLSMYGIGHLWVPRFSGVPAIAAGAIKGELHSTMPAMILLPLGFALDSRALIIAGGSFAFFGFFTYMGVLGANIMRNKSPTNRVMPEFVYVPWTFSGIFWLISGVLMGVFLNVVPELLESIEGGLTSIHVHIALFGGIIQLIMGWLTRIIPGDRAPPRFASAMKNSFFAFNGAVLAALWYVVTPSNLVGLSAVGLLVLALGLYYLAMEGFIRSTPTASK